MSIKNILKEFFKKLSVKNMALEIFGKCSVINCDNVASRRHNGRVYCGHCYELVNKESFGGDELEQIKHKHPNAKMAILDEGSHQYTCFCPICKSEINRFTPVIHSDIKVLECKSCGIEVITIL